MPGLGEIDKHYSIDKNGGIEEQLAKLLQNKKELFQWMM